jgi:predicted nucleic acid-binding protein
MFWDASAIVPLLVAEAGSDSLLAQLEHDARMFAWWGTPVECVSAVSRLERDGALTLAEASIALERLRALSDAWHEVLPSEGVRSIAQRLLRVHPLRAADSLQLAAALVACEGDPTRLPFVSRDDRLAEAAIREGFSVRG